VEPGKTKISRCDLLRALERSDVFYGVRKTTEKSGFDLFKTPGRSEVRQERTNLGDGISKDPRVTGMSGKPRSPSRESLD